MPKKQNTNPTTDSKENKQVPQYANVIKDKRDILKQYLVEKTTLLRSGRLK